MSLSPAEGKSIQLVGVISDTHGLLREQVIEALSGVDLIIHAGDVGGQKVGVFNLGGEFHAIDDICTHAHASLSEGEVDGDEVACPLHFATFNIRTGACTAPPADEDVQTYAVRVEGEEIQVQSP